MSYDLVVFEPDSRLKKRVQFTKWYETQTKWEEDHDYLTIKNTTPKLKAWLLDSIQQFPSADLTQSNTTEHEFDTSYSVGTKLLYCCYAWSQAEKAHEVAFALAQKHAVGFYDVSSEVGQVWMPNKNGELLLVHSNSGESRQKFWTDAPPCPKCGKQLRTKLAQQCFECGADWH